MRRVGSIRMLMAVLALTMLVPHPGWAQERAYEWGWGMHPMSGLWGIWGMVMMLMMLVFWGVVISGFVSDPALEILRQRYARGEINKEEFEARKRDLS
jgi:putative membrane protein